MTPDDPDKKGAALNAQRFQMLSDIAQELSGEVVFPTYFDAVLRLRKTLHDPNASTTDIAHAVSIEPLVSAKLLHLANSAAYNPGHQELVDLKSAITRLGLNVVRSVSLGIAMAQLMRAKGMADFSKLTEILWVHSIETASAAYVIAKTCTRINPDEAMLAGLIHDLGAFYMLYRATQYEELRHRPDTTRHLIVQWHESIGVSLLNALGLPNEIISATIDHDHERPIPDAPRSLADIIYIANLFGGGVDEWLLANEGVLTESIAQVRATYAPLEGDIQALSKELRTNLH